MADRVSRRVAQKRQAVDRMRKQTSWLEEAAKAPAADTAALAELRDRFPIRRPAEVPPTERELVRQELAARLRNLETLADELRDVVDAAGEAVSVVLLEHLACTCGELEVALAGAVESAAEGAGVVAA